MSEDGVKKQRNKMEKRIRIIMTVFLRQLNGQFNGNYGRDLPARR
jgi:hypothetical protein